MTPEIILTLIGMGGSFTVVIGGAMFALVRWLMANEKSKVEALLADHENRIRKVEADASDSVTRSDWDALRRDLDQRFERITELLTDAARRPARARR